MENCPKFQNDVLRITNKGYFIAKLAFISIFFILLFPRILATPIFAATVNTGDTSFGIANYLPVVDQNVEDGDIVSFSPAGYFLSKSPYDTQIIGIVTSNPAVSLEILGSKKSYPVVATGNTFVNVTTTNGNIKKGDSITTSTIPGKGMKATKTGYIVGVAVEDYSSTNTKAVKKLGVTLNVHFYLSPNTANNSIFNVVDLSALATYDEPIKAFKYFVASLTVVLSFVFGFFSFARTATKGLEALGRNPLASRIIQFGILLNTIVAIIIILSGLIVAFFVIRL